jgi:dienelactone hydrolase
MRLLKRPAGRAGPAAAPAPWAPPPYADPSLFEEQEVTLGTGPLAVPGTLSLPRAPGPRPGIVLLAGGGPFDRDETAGPNKPLKDLAWGLASRGAAVVRFDKVTHVHRDRIAGTDDFTLADEYIPHATAAAALLREHPAVDASRVFVVGHSAGGKAAPRVAAADPSIAGIAVMAGDTRPMHHAAVRVLRYIASLSPGAARELRQTIKTVEDQARVIDAPEFGPASGPVLGAPASYWLDLRAYDPVAVAATLDRPVLILQGGRDYQVTVADDLAGWRAGLARRPGVAIRVYEADNHLFFPGTGPSTPADYEAADHVDPQVVDDIAAWVRGDGAI